jgi:hypothetical protein
VHLMVCICNGIPNGWDQCWMGITKMGENLS